MNFKLMKTVGCVTAKVIDDVNDFVFKVKPQPSSVKLDDLTIDTLYKETYLHHLKTVKECIERQIEIVENE